MSESAVSYPPIEPTNFDLIVLGTGLPESVIAAAASSNGKTVLHLDPNSFYGSHFSSLSLHELSSFLNSHSTRSPQTTSTTTTTTSASNGHDFTTLTLTPRPLYSHLEISSFTLDETLAEHSRRFNLDVAGPRVLFCSDKSIDLMLKTGASQYVEFKSVEASFVRDENGQFVSVPDSRAAIFMDKSLGLTEKNQLMRFFKLVQNHLAAAKDDDENSSAKISDEDLETPFAEFLKKMRLPPNIKSIILYAIAMADYDQENVEVCKDVLKTKDGIERLAVYNSSIGRFSNALGALIYPFYGQGELSQAFCRRAAVKGCLYVLRMPVVALLMDKSTGHYKGVRLSSGQDLFSHQLVLDPSFVVPLPLASSPPDPLKGSLQASLTDVERKVARGICVTSRSLSPDALNLLLVFPPRSLYPEQVTSVRALQICSDLAVCPSGMFVLYFSALCDDANEGKKLLNAAMDALLTVPESGHPESSTTVQSENAEEAKPILLWKALYIQELTMDQFGSISSTPMPDGNLSYNDLLDATMTLFQKMYPHEEFFPESTLPENPEDDDGLSLES